MCRSPTEGEDTAPHLVSGGFKRPQHNGKANGEAKDLLCRDRFDETALKGERAFNTVFPVESGHRRLEHLTNRDLQCKETKSKHHKL